MAPSKTSFNASRSTIFRFDPNELVIIGIDTDDGPEHELWDARINEPKDSESLQALALDISVRGIGQPIIVRKDGGKAQVVVGRRRVRAARIANATLLSGTNQSVKVPAVRRDGDALDMVGMMVAENEHREADAFLERARKAAKMRALGASMAEVAVAFGVQVAAVRRWIRVLELDQVIIDAIRDDLIAPYAAMELSTLPREQQLEAFHMAMEAAKEQPEAPEVVTAPSTQPDGSDTPSGQQGGSEPTETLSPVVAPPEAPKGPSAAQVKAAKARVKGDDAPKTKPPKKRPVKLLREVAEAIEAADANDLAIAPQAVAMLKWVIGVATELDVEGLADLLESLTASK